jgi:hypothetical protein
VPSCDSGEGVTDISHAPTGTAATAATASRITFVTASG